MSELVLLDEFHVHIQVPSNLPPEEDAAIRRALTSRRLDLELARAIRQVFRRLPVLRRVRVTVWR
jgi:hypothetical protein